MYSGFVRIGSELSLAVGSTVRILCLIAMQGPSVSKHINFESFETPNQFLFFVGLPLFHPVLFHPNRLDPSYKTIFM